MAVSDAERLEVDVARRVLNVVVVPDVERCEAGDASLVWDAMGCKTNEEVKQNEVQLKTRSFKDYC